MDIPHDYFLLIYLLFYFTGLWISLPKYSAEQFLLVSGGYCPFHWLQYQAVFERL